MLEYDTIIRGGTLIDGSGIDGFKCDIAIKGKKIAAIGDLDKCNAIAEINAVNKIVCPGFINVLSWAVESLQKDGRGLSDLKQGVTLEVMGEGESWGPLNERMKQELFSPVDGSKSNVVWTTLGEFLDFLVHKGVSVNVASFVGTGTIRNFVLGHEQRRATTAEIIQMQSLVSEAMQEGAMGVSSALIYTPDAYFDTTELIALAKIAAEYNGIYISHIRNEGDGILQALDELITIGKEAQLPCEIYHIKLASPKSWQMLEQVISKIEQAQSEGLAITANQYPYAAGATGLDAIMPPWVREGGHDKWVKRLKDARIRKIVKTEILDNTGDWENMYLDVGPDNIMLAAFVNPQLRQYSGQTLATVAEQLMIHPIDLAMDLVIEDDSRVFCCYFSMKEENIQKKFVKPWVSICSDAEADCIDKTDPSIGTHPRGYGSFAKVLGEYVRERKLVSLPEAIRKMTSLPANTLKLKKRGLIKEDYYADVVVFDPEKINATSTYENPRSYAIGVNHVWVNGQLTLHHGEHTGAFAGQVVRGPGFLVKGK